MSQDIKIILPDTILQEFIRRYEEERKKINAQLKAERIPDTYPRYAYVLDKFISANEALFKPLALKGRISGTALQKMFDKAGGNKEGWYVQVAHAVCTFIGKTSTTYLGDYCDATPGLSRDDIKLGSQVQGVPHQAIFSNTLKPEAGSRQKQTFKAIADIREKSDLAVAQAGLIEKVFWQDTETGIYLGEVYIERDIENHLVNCVSSSLAEMHIVIGDAGSGKTSLLWHLYSKLETVRFRVLLKSSMLQTINFDELFAELARAQIASGVFLIDTLDLLAHGDADKDKLIITLNSIVAAGHTVIATSRPIEADLILTHMTATKQHLRELSSTEIGLAIKKYKAVYCKYAGIDAQSWDVDPDTLANNNSPLYDLCKSPLTLRMFFSLYTPDEVPSEINVFMLYSTYWERRVVKDRRMGMGADQGADDDLSALVHSLAIVMLSQGFAEVYLGDMQRSIHLSMEGIQKLHQRGLIQIARSEHREGDRLSFFHQTFFEHAAARALIALAGDQGLHMLADRIGARHDIAYSLYLLPVFEQAILIASTGPYHIESESLLSKWLLSSEDHVYLASGLYVYALFSYPSASLAIQIVHLMTSDRFKKNNDAKRRFLAIAPSITADRITQSAIEVEAIWQHSDWTIRSNAILAFALMCNKNKQCILALLSRNDIVEYVVGHHQEHIHGEHSTVYKPLITLLLKLYDKDPEWVRAKLSMLIETGAAAVILDILALYMQNRRAGLDDLIPPMLAAYVRAYGTEDSARIELGDERVDTLCPIWVERWDKLTSAQILADLQAADLLIFQEVKAAAFVRLLYRADRRLDVAAFYSSFKSNNSKFQAVTWSKWIFSRLIDMADHSSDSADLLQMFIRGFNESLQKLSSGQKPGLAAHPFEVFYEAFYKAKHPQHKAFSLVDQDLLLSLSLWDKQERLVDIFVTAFKAGFAPAVKLAEEIRSGSLGISNIIAGRLQHNVVSRKFFDTPLIEILVQYHLTQSDMVGFTGLLEHIFSRMADNLGPASPAAIMAHYSLRMTAYTARHSHVDSIEKEALARLWALMVEHGVVPPPSYGEVTTLFPLIRPQKYKVPSLLTLLPWCRIAGQNELQLAITTLKDAMTRPKMKTEAELCYLRILGKTDFSIADLEQEIMSVLFSDWGAESTDEKIRLLKGIILAQFKINPDFACRLLYSFITSDLLKNTGDRRKTKVTHSYRSVFGEVLKGSTDEFTIDVIGFLSGADKKLSRGIIYGISVNIRLFNEKILDKIKAVIADPETDPGVRDILRKQTQHHLMGVRQVEWPEVLSALR